MNQEMIDRIEDLLDNDKDFRAQFDDLYMRAQNDHSNKELQRNLIDQLSKK